MVSSSDQSACILFKRFLPSFGTFCCVYPRRFVYDDLVAKGVIQPADEVPPPTVPMDYSWARVSMPTNMACEFSLQNVYNNECTTQKAKSNYFFL